MAQGHKVCEACKENAATVHLTEMANQHVVNERHLCDVCAAKQGVIGKFQMSTIAELIGNLKEKTKGGAKEADLKCPDCGISYSEFRTKARFGCARDYDVFRKHVIALLEKIHGASEHAGKKPKGGVTVVPAPAAPVAAAPAAPAAVPAPVPAKGAGKAGKAHAAPAAGPAVPATPDAAELEKELERLIKAEEYEKAAKLRDRIRELKGKKETP